MKIKNNTEARVKVISQTDKRAEVVVAQPGPDGRTVHTTRHLQRKGQTWKDVLGNEYE